MKHLFLSMIAVAAITISSCKKEEQPTIPKSLEKEVNLRDDGGTFALFYPQADGSFQCNYGGAILTAYPAYATNYNVGDAYIAWVSCSNGVVDQVDGDNFVVLLNTGSFATPDRGALLTQYNKDRHEWTPDKPFPYWGNYVTYIGTTTGIIAGKFVRVNEGSTLAVVGLSYPSNPPALFD